MSKVLVTGAQGQLGQCLQKAVEKYNSLEVHFTDTNELDITDSRAVESIFEKHAFDYCINAAAYTNVEKAEEEADRAYKINAEGCRKIALACKESNCVLIHLSTDYVFDGTKDSPYTETDTTHPLNVYGSSKLEGERYIMEMLDRYFIFRISWLYSLYGHNFLNTIIRNLKANKLLKITTEQTGTPTNAHDIAGFILRLIATENMDYGLYHLTNTGSGTWYDFARAIAESREDLNASLVEKTDYYRTFAARPAYSVLDNSKAKKVFNTSLPDWRESLNSLMNTDA